MTPPRLAKKVILLGVAAAMTVLLGVGYLLLVGHAHAREIQAACRGMLPSPNRALGIIPRPAIDFTAKDRDGKPVKLSDFRGRVVILNFWASWCETCEKERHTLEELQSTYDRNDLVVLKVASDSDWKKVDARFPEGTHLTLVVDPPAEEGETGPITQRYGVEKVPESFLIDRAGNVRQYFVNKRDWSSGIVSTCLRSVIDEG